MSDINNETEQLNDNTVAKMLNESESQAYEENSGKNVNGTQEQSSALQEQTEIIRSNTNALKSQNAAYNESIAKLNELKNLLKEVDELKKNNSEQNIAVLATKAQGLENQYKVVEQDLIKNNKFIQEQLNAGRTQVYRAGDFRDPYGNLQSPAYGHGVEHVTKYTDEPVDLNSGAFWDSSFEQVKSFYRPNRKVLKAWNNKEDYLQVSNEPYPGIVNDTWDNLTYLGEGKDKEESIKLIEKFLQLEKELASSSSKISQDEVKKMESEINNIVKRMNYINKDLTDPRSFGTRFAYNLGTDEDSVLNYSSDDYKKMFTPKTTDAISHAAQVYHGQKGVIFYGVTDSGGTSDQRSVANDTRDEILHGMNEISEFGRDERSLVRSLELLQRNLEQGIGYSDPRNSQFLESILSNKTYMSNEEFSKERNNAFDIEFPDTLKHYIEQAENSTHKEIGRAITEQENDLKKVTELYYQEDTSSLAKIFSKYKKGSFTDYNLGEKKDIIQGNQKLDDIYNFSDEGINSYFSFKHFVSKSIENLKEEYKKPDQEEQQLQEFLTDYIKKPFNRIQELINIPKLLYEDFLRHNGDTYDGDLLTPERIKNASQFLFDILDQKKEIERKMNGLDESNSIDDEDASLVNKPEEYYKKIATYKDAFVNNLKDYQEDLRNLRDDLLNGSISEEKFGIEFEKIKASISDNWNFGSDKTYNNPVLQPYYTNKEGLDTEYDLNGSFTNNKQGLTNLIAIITQSIKQIYEDATLYKGDITEQTQTSSEPGKKEISTSDLNELKDENYYQDLNKNSEQYIKWLSDNKAFIDKMVKAFESESISKQSLKETIEGVKSGLKNEFDLGSDYEYGTALYPKGKILSQSESWDFETNVKEDARVLSDIIEQSIDMIKQEVSKYNSKLNKDEIKLDNSNNDEKKSTVDEDLFNVVKQLNDIFSKTSAVNMGLSMGGSFGTIDAIPLLKKYIDENFSFVSPNDNPDHKTFVLPKTFAQDVDGMSISPQNAETLDTSVIENIIKDTMALFTEEYKKELPEDISAQMKKAADAFLEELFLKLYNNNGLKMGSLIVGPSITAADTHKVNDLIITKNGKIFETDDADNIIAAKHLGGYREGENNVIKQTPNNTQVIGQLGNDWLFTIKEASSNFKDTAIALKMLKDTFGEAWKVKTPSYWNNINHPNTYQDNWDPRMKEVSNEKHGTWNEREDAKVGLDKKLPSVLKNLLKGNPDEEEYYEMYDFKNEVRHKVYDAYDKLYNSQNGEFNYFKEQKNNNEPVDQDIINSFEKEQNNLKALLDNFNTVVETVNRMMQKIYLKLPHDKLVDTISLNSDGVTYNIKATPVDDLVITKDGRAYVTDDADNLIATKDLAGLGKSSGMNRVVRERTGEILAILDDKDQNALLTLANALDKLTSDKDRIQRDIESAIARKDNTYNRYAAQMSQNNIDTSITKGRIDNIMSRGANAWSPYAKQYEGEQELSAKWWYRFNMGDESRRQVADAKDKIFNNTENDDQSVRKLRDTLAVFYQYKSFMNDIATNDFATLSERNILSNYLNNSDKLGTFGSWVNMVKRDADGKAILDENGNPTYVKTENGNIAKEWSGTGLLGEFGYYRDLLTKTQDALKNENLSLEERGKLSAEAVITQGKYEEALQAVIQAVEEATKQTQNEVDAEKEKTKAAKNGNRFVTDDNNKKINRDEYKYALFRNKVQQEAFLLDEDIPKAYATTANWKDSFKKTVFNRSVGYRQRQGLVGMAANLGYNASGTVASIGLGALATGFKKATEAVLQFAKGATQAFGEIESIKTNLGIVYGSQSQADQTFSDIAAYSVKSPFGVQTVSEYAVLLKQSGIYASDLMSTLKQIGDVAGGNQEKFANIANSFSQIEANGKATTRQLRQFATAGIPIYKELTKAYEQINGQSVGIEQIRKLTEEGKISARIIEQAFSNMTGTGGTFENAVNIGAKTWKARLQNLADAKQLAQAEFGKWILNIGGSGRNDSIAYQLVTMGENLLAIVQNTTGVWNIEKSVSNIEKQDDIVSKLQQKYTFLKNAGASQDVLDDVMRQIQEADNTITYEQRRSAEKAKYDLEYKNQVSGKEILSDEDYNDLASRAAYIVNSTGKYKIVESNGKYGYWSGGVNTHGYQQFNLLNDKQIADMENARYDLEHSISQSAYDEFQQSVEEVVTGAMLSSANNFIATEQENTDKSNNKNEYGIYSMWQKSQQQYKGTDVGQREETRKDNNKLENAQVLWDKYNPFVTEEGQLSKKFTGTLEEAVRIFDSGIIQPLEEIDFKPEKLSSERKFLNIDEAIARTEEVDRNNTWNKLMNNLVNNIDVVLGSKDITKGASDLIKNFSNELYSTETVYGPNGQERKRVLKTNSTENVEEIGQKFGELLLALDKIGAGDAVRVLARSGVVGAKTGRPEYYSDALPLWKRVLSSSFGFDESLWKQGTLETGGDAISKYFNRKSQQDVIKSTISTMLKDNSIANVLAGNGGLLAYTGNESYKKTNQIDWGKTFENIGKIAMGEQSTSEVTKSFADSLTQQADTIDQFITAAITTMENPSNVYDEKYKKEMDNLWSSIEAFGANPFDLGFTRDEKTGAISYTESAVQSASDLRESYRYMAQAATSQASLKELRSNASKNQIKSIMTAMLATKSFRDAMVDSNGQSRIVTKANGEGETGPKKIDWNETAKNFANFAISLDSAASVTNAYTSSLQEEQSSLIEFLQSSVLTETPDNIYDKDYQDNLKYYADALKKANNGSYDLLFEELDDGTLKLKQNAPEAAEQLLEFTQDLMGATSVLGNFKNSLEELVKETSINKIKADYKVGVYDNSALFNNNMSQGQKDLIFNNVLDTLTTLFNDQNTKRLFGDMSIGDAVAQTMKSGDLSWINSPVLQSTQELRNTISGLESRLSTLLATNETESDLLKRKQELEKQNNVYLGKGIGSIYSDYQNYGYYTNSDQYKQKEDLIRILGDPSYRTEEDTAKIKEAFESFSYDVDYNNPEEVRAAEEDLLNSLTLTLESYNSLAEAYLKDAESKEKTVKENKAALVPINSKLDYLDTKSQLDSYSTVLEEKLGANDTTQKVITTINNANDSLIRFSNASELAADQMARLEDIDAWTHIFNLATALEGGIGNVNKDNEELNKLTFYNPLINGKQSVGNTMRQQQMVNVLGKEGAKWKDLRREQFGGNFTTDENGVLAINYNNREIEKLFNSTKWGQNKSDDVQNLQNDIESLVEWYNLLNEAGNSEGAKAAYKDLIKKQKEYNELIDKASQKSIFKVTGIEELLTQLDELNESIKNTFKSELIDGFNNTMKTLGSNWYKLNESIIDQEQATKNLQNVWKQVGLAMLDAIGPAMTEAGFALISGGARLNNWAEVAAGVGLVAAGGVASIASGFLGASNDDDDDDKEEEERLEKLRDLLKEIIDQAKTDAAYYENHMRHNEAISVSYDATDVNDMILTPHGNFSTAPDDYIIATKTPGSLGSGGSSPVINFSVIDQSQGGKVNVETQQKQNADGSIDIIAVVKAAVGEGIANGDFDNHFTQRQVRLQGRTYTN